MKRTKNKETDGNIHIVSHNSICNSNGDWSCFDSKNCQTGKQSASLRPS